MNRIIGLVLLMLAACVPATAAQKGAGPYLLATDIGMKARGPDNSPYNAALMSTLGSYGGHITFPATPGAGPTFYYFSAPLRISRTLTIDCGGTSGSSPVYLVFPSGVDGVIYDSGPTSVDNAHGSGSINGCGVASPGPFQTPVGTPTRGSSVISAVSQSQSIPGVAPETWGAGDGLIGLDGYSGGPSQNANLLVPVGAYIDSASGTTNNWALTLHGGMTTTRTPSGHFLMWRLPASQAFTVRTKSGSNIVTVTSGPRLLEPGDVIWSDAFPFGTQVLKVSGAVGAQTVTMTNVFYDTSAGTISPNATITHNAGKLWIVPAALKRRTTGVNTLYSNFVGFPLGISMSCSSSSSPGINCTGSLDQGNKIQYSIVGRWVSGDNTGASSSIANIYFNNFQYDIMEAGQVGSYYAGDNSNSAEAAELLYPVVGNCHNSNASSFVGMYVGNASGRKFCMDRSVGVFGVPGTTGGGHPPLAIMWQADSLADMPTVWAGFLTGQWGAAGLRSGSDRNTDLTGRVTLSGGTATYTLQQTYSNQPNCLAQDVTTPSNIVYVRETTKTLSFHTTGGAETNADVVKYICHGTN